MEPGNLGERSLQLVEERPVPLCLFHRGKGMDVADLRPRHREHLGRRVQLQRARTECDHRVHQRQVLGLQRAHIALEVRFRPVLVEYGVREERARAGEALVEPGVHTRRGRVHAVRLAAEDRQQVAEIAGRRRLAHRHADGAVGEVAKVHLLRRRRLLHRGRATLGRDAHRVEEHVVQHRVPERAHPGRERLGTVMHPLRNALQPVGTVEHGVHAAHHGEEHLRRADVARRLLAADVLFARAQRHAHPRLAFGVTRDTDDAPRHEALELLLRGQERGVRAAVAVRHAEALRVADGDVGPPLARRREHRQCQQVSGHHHQCAGGVHPVAQGAVVLDGAEGVGILDQHAAHRRIEREPRCRLNLHRDAAGGGARLDDVDGLRMAVVGHQEGVAPALGRVQHQHRLGRRRPFVEQRGVGQRQPGEVDHDGLVIQQRLEAPLRNLRLVGRVRGVPAWILQDVALDHGRYVCAVIALPDEAAPHLVGGHQRLEIGEGVLFRQAGGEVERSAEADVRRHGGVDQRVERGVTEHLQHGLNVGVRRADMAGGKEVRLRKRGRSHCA